MSPTRAALAALWLAACAPAPPAAAPPALIADPPASGPGDRKPPSELERGVALIKAEQYADAKPHCEKAVELEPKSAEAHYYLGIVRAKTGDRPGAEASYKTALELDRDFSKAAETLAALYLEEPAQPDEAIRILEPLLPKRPESTSLIADLARAYGLKGDVPAASKHYEAAIAKGDSVVLRLAYGTMLADHKEHGRALEQLKRALEIAPEDGPLLATLGRKLAASGAFADCARAFDRALGHRAPAGPGANGPRPNEADWLVRRGECRHELKDDAGAMADYEAATVADPTSAAAHYHLGLALLPDRKVRARAVAELELAVKQGEGTPIAKSASEKLATLKPR